MATDYTLDSRCKLAYLFKEGSGTSVADSTTQGNTGTFNSSGHPAWDTNKPTFGSSGAGFGSVKYSTVGTSEIITDGTSDNLPNHNAAWTFCCWFNASTDTIGGGDPRFFVRGSVYVAFSQTQKVYVNIDGGTALTRFTGASAWALNTWTHLAVTSDGSTTAANYKIYINSVEVGTGVGSVNGVTPTSNSGATLYVGNNSTGTRAMPGYLTEVGFFNAALSASEVLEIYNTGLKPPNVTITPSALNITSTFKTPAILKATFPSTLVLDTFNRTNEGPPPSANWHYLYASSANDGFKVLSNQAVTTGTSGASYKADYWTNVFTGNAEVYTTIVTPAETNLNIFLEIWYSGYTTDFPNGYIIKAKKLAGTDTISVHRQTLGVETQLVSYNQEFSAGDSFGLSSIAGTLTAYYKASAGAWTILGTITDTTFSGSFVLGLDADGAVATVDDFGGGTVLYANTITPTSLNISSSVQTPSISTGSSVTINVSALNIVSATKSPTISASGNVTISPSTLNITSAAQTPSKNSTLSPSTLNITSTAQTPSKNTTISANTLNITSSALAPTVTVTSNVTINASALNITSTTRAPTVTGSGTNVTINPSALNITSSTRAPTVTTTSSVTISPTTLNIVSSTRGPTVNGSGTRKKNQAIMIS